MITPYSNTISVTTEKFPFEFTVNTAIAGTSGIGNFQLPLVSSLPLNAVVDWGDGSTDTITTFNQAETLHTYSSAVTHTIKITGALSGWQFNNTGDRLKMLNVASWGSLNISIGFGFFGCANLTCTATDAAFISGTSLQRYFSGCTNFNGNISNWNISNVNNISFMFGGASVFNQNIGSWNVSNVTTFAACFENALQFNNGNSDDIKNWVFSTTSFINMAEIFANASVFNQNIGSWNVSNVNNMFRMFRVATAFNQNIGSWDVSNVLNFNDFMAGKTSANYSAANLDSIYNGWSALLSVNPNLTITFGTIKHTAAGTAGRLVLTSAPNNWSITDGGI